MFEIPNTYTSFIIWYEIYQLRSSFVGNTSQMPCQAIKEKKLFDIFYVVRCAYYETDTQAYLFIQTVRMLSLFPTNA